LLFFRRQHFWGQVGLRISRVGGIHLRHFLFLLLMFAGMMLFFIDMKHESGSAVYQLYGLAHVAFFVFMAYFLSRFPSLALRPFLFQFVLIMFVVLLVGGIIELIQPHFGRTASLRDLGIDLLGGLLGIMFLEPARRSLRRGPLAFGQIAVAAMTVTVFYGPVVTLWDMRQASRQFPVLGDFETSLETMRWSSGEIDKRIARHGESSLRVSLETGKYSGTTLERSFGDWRGYSTFAFSIYNPDPGPLVITVSIRDEEHFRRGGEYHDRFNRVFTIEQGWNDVYIPIADIENAPSARRLELNHLSEVVIFTVDPPAPRVMYLDYVRLIR
jgi:VanZ family protein